MDRAYSINQMAADMRESSNIINLMDRVYYIDQMVPDM